MPRVLTNLRASPDRFVGRGADLGRIGGLLDEGARLVTLIGPPGVGKTRLARQFGEVVLARDDCGWGEIWFVDLTSAREVAARAPRAIALCVVIWSVQKNICTDEQLIWLSVGV